MKILMENKKKQLIYLGVMVVSVGVTIWMWTGGKASSPPVDSALMMKAMQGAVPGDGGSGVSRGLLPNGTGFNTKILTEPSFKELVPGKPLDVKKEELGRDNPFSSPSAQFQTQPLNPDLSSSTLPFLNSTSTVPTTIPTTVPTTVTPTPSTIPRTIP